MRTGKHLQASALTCMHIIALMQICNLQPSLITVIPYLPDAAHKGQIVSWKLSIHVDAAGVQVVFAVLGTWAVVITAALQLKGGKKDPKP